ncbi:MAG: hypothetical protein K1060chlam3_00281 [Candidatus Anoxychlamydiales bacterium]|nr:hypothetical protein [Candidatus Anoxychlamydiales bacterium]
MAAKPVCTSDQTYYSQSISEIKKLEQALFEKPNSKKLQETIERIRSFMSADKKQFDYLSMRYTQLQNKLLNTPETTPIDHETSSSSSSSLNFTNITYHQQIVSDIQNLKKRLVSVSNSHNQEYIRKINNTIERIESIVSLQFKSLKRMDELLAEKSLNAPEPILGNHEKETKSDSALPHLSKKERLGSPMYVQSLREQNIELAKALNKLKEIVRLKELESDSIHEELSQRNKELSEDNELLAENLEKAAAIIVDLREELRSPSFIEYSENEESG